MLPVDSVRTFPHAVEIKVIIIIIGHTVYIREIKLEERKEERGNQSGSIGTLAQKCT